MHWPIKLEPWKVLWNSSRSGAADIAWRVQSDENSLRYELVSKWIYDNKHGFGYQLAFQMWEGNERGRKKPPLLSGSSETTLWQSQGACIQWAFFFFLFLWIISSSLGTSPSYLHLCISDESEEQLCDLLWYWSKHEQVLKHHHLKRNEHTKNSWLQY